MCFMKTFVSHTVCNILTSFLLLSFSISPTRLQGQESGKQLHIRELVSSLNNLKNKGPSVNPDPECFMKYSAVADRDGWFRVNYIRPIKSGLASDVPLEMVSHYLASYAGTSIRFADSIALEWMGKKAHIAVLEWSVTKKERDTSLYSVAVLTPDGKLLFDGILSNSISEVDDIRSFTATGNDISRSIEASARVSSLTGSVTLHWRVAFTAQSSLCIEPGTDGRFNLITSEITCWKTDPYGIPPQGEPVVYFGSDGTAGELNDLFVSTVTISDSPDHFSTGIYACETSDGKGDSQTALFNIVYENGITVSPPDVPDAPVRLSASSSEGQSMSIVNQIRANPDRKKYEGVFWNSGFLKLENFTVAAEEGGYETGKITADIPVNCAYTFWDATPIFQDVLHAGTASLPVEYTRGHSLPNPICQTAASDYSLIEGQQTTITVRITNPSKVADIVAGTVSLDSVSMTGILSLTGSAAIPLDTIPAGQSREYAFVLEGASAGNTKPEITIIWQWGCPADCERKTLSMVASPDRSIEVLPPPSITVTSPEGSESLQSGLTYDIEWTSSRTSGIVELSYSADNGVTWISIADSVPDNGSFGWNVPVLYSRNCLVRVSDAAGPVSDQNNSVFTIWDTPVLTVASPNGGESWEPGSIHNITWYSSGNSGNINISYSVDGGSVWVEIVSSTPDDGVFEWTLPQITSSACLVRLTDTDGNPSDLSNSLFTIARRPQINIISPNGGEIWEAGSVRIITWTSFGSGGNVRLLYSSNNGNSWIEITDNTPDDGSFSWTIPDVRSSQCLVSVSDIDGTPGDQSDSVFTIPSPPFVTVTSPNGGETFLSGTPHPITWTSGRTSGRVQILFSADNGTGWTEITNDTPDDGSFTWIIPEIPSPECLVMVRDADASPAEQSNAVFIITDICTPATFVSQPSDIERCPPAGSASFEVSLTGLPPFRYQWQINHNGAWTDVTDGMPAGAKYIDATTARLTVSGIYEAGIYQFRCRVAFCQAEISESRIASLTVHPSSPAAMISTILQPTCHVPAGSVILNNLPAEGSWTLTLIPGLQTFTGTGSNFALGDLEPGVYSCTITNQWGCKSEMTGEFEIEKPDPGVIPEITIKYSDVLICYNLGDSLISYQWYEGQNPIPDATLQYYQTHKQPGEYRVFTTDRDGCSNFSDAIVLSRSKSLVAFPNPAYASFKLMLEDYYEGSARILVLNSSGTRVFEKYIRNVSDEILEGIPVDNLKSGLYMVRVFLDNNEILYTKIMVSN